MYLLFSVIKKQNQEPYFELFLVLYLEVLCLGEEETRNFMQLPARCHVFHTIFSHSFFFLYIFFYIYFRFWVAHTNNLKGNILQQISAVPLVPSILKTKVLCLVYLYKARMPDLEDVIKICFSGICSQGKRTLHDQIYPSNKHLLCAGTTVTLNYELAPISSQFPLFK